MNKSFTSIQCVIEHRIVQKSVPDVIRSSDFRYCWETDGEETGMPGSIIQEFICRSQRTDAVQRPSGGGLPDLQGQRYLRTS